MAPPAAVLGQNLHFYLPNFAGGGAERFFVRLANHYAAQGHNVHFIVNTDTGPIRSLLSDQVDLRVLGKSRGYRALPGLIAYLRANDVPVLLSALTRTNIVALTAARLARSGTRVIVCERNQFSTLHKGLGRVQKALVTTAVRRLYPKATAVIGNTPGVTRDIAQVARLPEAKTGVIGNPAPDQDQISAARAAPADHPWLSDDLPVAVAIGRLVPQKNYETMLRAVALSDPDLRLIVLGTGPEHDRLERLSADLGLQDRVDFAGFRMDRFSYLVAADLFLISSITEGFPNALIEAVAAGLPCVTTNFAGGGAYEILGDSLAQWIVPVEDPQAMAEVIGAILDDGWSPTDRTRIAERADLFDISGIANAFLARMTTA